MDRHDVVIAPVTVTHRVGRHDHRASVDPLHVFRSVGNRSGEDVTWNQSADSDRTSIRACRPVKHLRAIGRGNRQRSRCDRTKREWQENIVVRTTVTVIDRIARVDPQHTLVGTQGTVSRVTLGQARDGITSFQPARCRQGSSGGRAIINLGVRCGSNGKGGRRDRPIGAGHGHRIVGTTIAVIDRVAGNQQHAAICPQNIFGSVRFRPAGHSIRTLKSSHGRRRCGRCRRIVNLRVRHCGNG